MTTDESDRTDPEHRSQTDAEPRDTAGPPAGTARDRGDATPAITRRRALGALAATGATALSGCLGLFETRSAGNPPPVENRPKAVYVPTHFDGMSTFGAVEAGGYRVVGSVATPHRFWLITGRNRDDVTVQEGDSVHMMFTLIDRETGIVPPSGNVEVEVRRDGDLVDERSMWPMLSQRMGFHFGDNIPLEGDGSYEVTARIGPVDARTTGAFQGRFDDAVEASFTYDYSREEIENLPFTPLEDRQGERGAVQPMDMEMLPIHQLPEADAMPGALLDDVESADGRFVVSRLEEPPAGIEGSGPYLAVSARTPYHRFPLPFMGLSATVESGGETTFDGGLTAALDPDLDYHYGATVDSLSSGDTLELSFGAPPQVSRHEGYETAFMEFEDRTIDVE